MAALAVVTGASSGIGRSYAERLASDGMDLVLIARRADRLNELERELADRGVKVRSVVADLGRAEDLQRVTEQIEPLPVDLLINNAGLAHYMPFAQLPAERARELVDVNALAPVLLTRAVVPGMLGRGRGSIINVASLLAFSGAARAPFLPQRALYAATKAFLVTFAEILAAELVGTGVKVQVVCPGVVRSEFHSRQGIDMSKVPRMEPDQIVSASLSDLERGVVVSIPALPDESGKTRLDEAASALLAVARNTELPLRYRDG
ncbi:MAG TPA: SDR family oxidoreductase [Casimicrobiaceae bacterium]|nr:SDR family oxidoreductase [Casimicrobiaceae bacterium]